MTTISTATRQSKAAKVPAGVTVAVVLMLALRMALGLCGLVAPHLLGWADPIYDVGTYAITVTLIWVTREHWGTFHVDPAALVILVLVKPLQTLILAIRSDLGSALAFPHVAGLLIWLTAGLLVVILTALGRRFLAPSMWGWGNLGIGFLAGAAFSLVLGVASAFQFQASGYASGQGLFALLAPVSYVYQLGYAAASEEPLFRGFLWGVLRAHGWTNLRILVVQALLFSLVHLDYVFVLPLSFWIIVPLGGLFLGLVVWKTRTIAASMMAHAAINTFAPVFATMIVPLIR